MKFQTKPGRVVEFASHFVKKRVYKENPCWIDVVAKHPPEINLTKVPRKFTDKTEYVDPATMLENDAINPKTGSFKTRVTRPERSNKHKYTHRVPKLEFLEDQLRDVFYHHHPWELARPKTLIENGRMNNNGNWSRLLQLGQPLDGECVVQRTLYILKNEVDKDGNKYSLFDAYDKARFEYYKLRMREEMESHVAREESTMYGGIHVNSVMDAGLKHEQEAIDRWAVVAKKETDAVEAGMSSTNAPRGSMVEEDKPASMFEAVLGSSFVEGTPLENAPKKPESK
ncbi:RSM25 [[Candida] subhashii]|uniref:37S ribosomal protein S25, mitochondrial n=1 Tax=[Candida] subhashii TaxID=561895 RepID=A0A8J5QT62_9ASCO|nr:RSM25 [[Candida] subhashii]KAG7666101.1 RSM25 [[Candida] subhashii]